MTRYSKRYANSQQKNPGWRKHNGMEPGRKRWTPNPSSRAAKRKAKK